METEDLMHHLARLDPSDPTFQKEWKRLIDSWKQDLNSTEPHPLGPRIPLELVASGHTGQALFDWVCRYLVRNCEDVDFAAVGEYLSYGDEIYVRSIFGKEGALDPFHYHLEGTPCHRVLSDQSLCSYPSQVVKLFPADQMLSEMQIEGYMGTALRAKSGETLGILIVMSQRPFQEEAYLKILLEGTCERISAEMERLLFEEKSQQRERLALKEQQIMEHLLSETDLEATLDEVVAMIEAEDEQVMGSILLHEEIRGVLRHGAAHRLPKAFARAVDGEPIGPQAGSCGTAIFRKAEVIVTDIVEDPLWENYRGLALQHGLRACWSVPVIGENQHVLGSFAMYLSEPGSPSEAHLELLRRAAALTGVVITYHRSRQALEVSERQFRQLFERNHAVMLLIDPTKGEIVEANHAAQAYYGYAATDMARMKVWDLNVQEEAVLRERMQQVVNQEVKKLRFQHRLQSGEIREVEVHSGPVETPRGVFLYSIIHDVTDRVRAEQALQQLNEELEARVEERTRALEATNRELEAFTYAVSHDLRAPLRTINGFAGLLRRHLDANASQEAKEYLKLIEEGAIEMNELISGLLELSRCTVGELTLHQVDLSFLAQDHLEQLQRQEPDHPAEINVEPGLEAQGDPRMLNALFDNLLSNAWKYSQPSEPRKIDFGLTQTEKGPTYFVRDNGIGFGLEDHERLFKPFQRLEGALAYPGIGIGLATVQRIVKRHEGEIWAESEPGKGTTFYFTLRLGEGA